MQSVPAEKGIVLFKLDLLSLELFVAACDVPGRRFPFLARFRALDRDVFSWHKILFFFFGRLLFSFFFLLGFRPAGAVNRAELAEPPLA